MVAMGVVLVLVLAAARCSRAVEFDLNQTPPETPETSSRNQSEQATLPELSKKSLPSSSFHSLAMIEIPMPHFPRGTPRRVVIEMVRQHHEHFQHFDDSQLTQISRKFRRSMWHLLNCFDNHCQKDEAEFMRRHPTFSRNIRSFHRRYCSGTESCKFMLKKSLKEKHKATKNHKRKRVTRVIPPMIKKYKANGQIDYVDLLAQAESHDNLYGDIPADELTSTSHKIQRSARNMLHCFKRHCCNVSAFAEKHQEIMPNTFCEFGCSSLGPVCNSEQRHAALIDHRKQCSRYIKKERLDRGSRGSQQYID